MLSSDNDQPDYINACFLDVRCYLKTSAVFIIIRIIAIKMLYWNDKEDNWWMIWEHKSYAIMTLTITELEENGRV